MRSLLAYWDAVLIFCLVLLFIGLLGLGVGALTFWLASSTSPAMLGCASGAMVSTFLLFVFLRSLRD